MLRTTSDNQNFDSTKIVVLNHQKPQLGPDQTQEFCPATFVDETSLFSVDKNTTLNWFTLSGLPVDSTTVPFEVVQVIATNEFGCKDTALVMPQAYPVKHILPASPQERIANREQLDPDDPTWTNYYYDYIDNLGMNDTFLLLSLQKNGNDIGNVGDGVFQVKVVATSAAGSGHAVLLANPQITNPQAYAMNRYWMVTPKNQPDPDNHVGVRYYYNNKDFDDLKSSIPYLTDDNSTDQNKKLFFYVAHGGNPDPTSNLDGAVIQELQNGEDVSLDTWKYTPLGCGENEIEFEIDRFSGGGGGATVNGLSLPLLLTNFTAASNIGSIYLNWQTAQEIHTSYFDIERSINGNNFSSIGQVNASGHSLSNNSYSFIDLKPLEGNNYYRLKMIDEDGKFTYSKVVSVKNDIASNSFRIFPNPANEILYIQTRSVSNDFAALQVFDASGRKLKDEKIILNGNSYQLNIKDLPKGVYDLLLKSKVINKHQKFMKQ